MEIKEVLIEVTLSGLAPLMFDRFFDHSGEERQPEEKLYLERGTNKLVMPAKNLEAFLTGERPPGAIKITEKKKANDYLPYVKGHVSFTQSAFPILDGDDQAIIFKDFTGQFEVDISSPRVIKSGLSIKQPPKKRPVLNLPWGIKLVLRLVETPLSKGKITSEKLHAWFAIGGLVVGLGTYRPLYGRFQVERWEVK